MTTTKDLNNSKLFYRIFIWCTSSARDSLYIHYWMVVRADIWKILITKLTPNTHHSSHDECKLFTLAVDLQYFFLKLS